MSLDTIAAPLTPLMVPGDYSRILFPVVERAVGWYDVKADDYHKITGSKALLRSVDGKGQVLNVVNSTYKLVDNRELFTAIENTIIEVVPATKLHNVKIKDHVSYSGRVCFREYVFPGIVCDIGAKSPLGFRVVVSNSYGGGAVRMLAGAIEFFCTNGCVSGAYESSYARHTSGLVVAGFATKINAALERFVKDAALWRRWVETPVKYEAAMALFKTLTNNETLQNNLTHQYFKEHDERGHNLWSVYSAMTYYASHNEGNFATRNQGETTGAASTMFKRELDVRNWVNSPAFKELEYA